MWPGDETKKSDAPFVKENIKTKNKTELDPCEMAKDYIFFDPHMVKSFFECKRK